MGCFESHYLLAVFVALRVFAISAESRIPAYFHPFSCALLRRFLRRPHETCSVRYILTCIAVTACDSIFCGAVCRNIFFVVAIIACQVFLMSLKSNVMSTRPDPVNIEHTPGDAADV